MKKNKYIFSSALCTLLCFIMVIYTACKKSHDPCEGVVCMNHGYCTNGDCICETGFTGTHCESSDSSIIVYQNNSLADINIIVDSVLTSFSDQRTVRAGNNTTYVGFIANWRLTASATAIANLTSPAPGITAKWDFPMQFPAVGTSVQTLQVPKNYFLLRVINKSHAFSFSLYVDSGTSIQKFDQVVILNDSVAYNVGFYDASINPTISLKGNFLYWSFNSLTLPDTANQTITLTLH